MLVDAILRGLDERFGFKYSAILVPAEEPNVLVTVATRGYPENGAGAEVCVRRRDRRHGRRGAQADPHLGPDARHALRLRDAREARAKPRAARRARRGASRCRVCRIPESQLGVPLLVRGELVGVLTLESEVPLSLPRRRQGVDRAARQLPRDCRPEHAAAGADDRSRGGRAAGPDAARAEGRTAAAAVTPRCRLLRRGRVHPAGWRVPDSQSAAKILWRLLKARQIDGTERVHQPRAAPRQVAEPAGVEGQPREPPAALAPPPRAEVPRHPPRPASPRPLRPRARAATSI